MFARRVGKATEALVVGGGWWVGSRATLADIPSAKTSRTCQNRQVP